MAVLAAVWPAAAVVAEALIALGPRGYNRVTSSGSAGFVLPLVALLVCFAAFALLVIAPKRREVVQRCVARGVVALAMSVG